MIVSRDISGRMRGLRDRPWSYNEQCRRPVGTVSLTCIRPQVWEVPTTMHAVTELAGRLVAEGVQKVTLESSDYWRIWFYVLEEAGLDVHLVRPARPGAWRGSCASWPGKQVSASSWISGLVFPRRTTPMRSRSR
jgi:hypothetical protein